MDYRPYILAGTFLLFLVALVTFIVTVVRARRHHHARYHTYLPEDALEMKNVGPLDTSLEGLEVRVGADALSASLLVPLKTGEWMPAEEPAPVAGLSQVSLAARSAGFQPVPDIREPSFVTEKLPSWQSMEGQEPGPVRPPGWAQSIPDIVTDDDLTAQLEEVLAPVHEPPAPSAAPVAPAIPQLAIPSVHVTIVQPGQSPVHYGPVPQPMQQVSPDISAAVLPQVVFPAIEPAPATVIASPAAPQPVPDEAAAPPVVIVPTPEVVTPPAVAPAPAGAPAPVDAGHDGLTIAVPQADSAPQPVVEPGPVPTPTPAARQQSGPESEEPAKGLELEWMGMIGEQQGRTQERPVAVAPPAAPRPPVTVSTQPVPAPAPVSEASTGTPRRPRPQVRVHTGQPAAETEETAGRRLAPLAVAPTARKSRGDVNVPDIVMEAPVEMWFGDARVGVKAGTVTYERFKKYADVLFEDLKAAERGTPS